MLKRRTPGRDSDTSDQFFEFRHAPVKKEIAYLSHRDGDDAAMGIVEPRRAIAAGPAVAAGDCPVFVGLDGDSHAEAIPAPAKNHSAGGSLFGCQVVGR